MRLGFRLLWVFVVGLALIVGCNEVTNTVSFVVVVSDGTLFPAIEGATFDLKDATGTAFYDEVTGDAWRSNVDLAATTSEGSGGFLNVVPGDFQIELGGMVSGCVPNQAWPGDAANRIGFPVREGFITVLSVNCSLP